MKDVEKRLVELLGDEALEKQIAAAIIVGELGLSAAATLDALAALLDGPVAPLRRHALVALGKLGCKRALPKIWPLLHGADEELRRAAGQAIVALGDEALPLVRERLAHASPEERRALESVLAELGGRDALGTLLAGLSDADAEGAKKAALAVRAQVKGADGRTRKSYLAELTKFLERAEKKGAPTLAIATALKIVGYLEDERALPLLTRYAQDEEAPATVRQEAVIALRFASGAHATAELVDALSAAAVAEDRLLAQTALHSLAALAAQPGETLALGKRLESLVTHRDPERARFVLDLLAKQPGAEATRLLVAAVASGDRARAEHAAEALRERADAAGPLSKALLATADPDRAWLLRQVLRPHARNLTPAQRKALVEAAAARIDESERGYEAHYEAARDADTPGIAEALRGLVAKARKAKKPEREIPLLRLLAKLDATDGERIRLAILELGRSALDTRPTARAGDPAIQVLSALEARGYDIGKALCAEKSLSDEALYYVGFHFAEEGAPAGAELLREVHKRGGRTKLAKMAKNKLELTERNPD